MGRIYEGATRADGKQFAIVASRFNSFIVDKLIEGAFDAFCRAGAADEDVDVFRCPGAFEIPGTLRYVTDLGRYHGIVCVGLALRGPSAHFEQIVNEATRGVARIAAECRVGLGFAVLACDTIEQAIERSGCKSGNRGADAALVAIEMANLYANDLVRGGLQRPDNARMRSNHGRNAAVVTGGRLPVPAVIKSTDVRQRTNGKVPSGSARSP